MRCGLSAIPQIRKRPENRTILGTLSYPTAMYRSAASRADRRARLIKPERRPVQLHFVHLRREHNVPLQTGDQRNQVRSLEKFETHVQRPTSVRDAETHHTHRSIDLHVDISFFIGSHLEAGDRTLRTRIPAAAPVCSSGMQALNRKKTFRPFDNSPFKRHLTLKALLCFDNIIPSFSFQCNGLFLFFYIISYEKL